MTSTRPYLIRAFYDWIVDNNCTPHIVVNAAFENVEVPLEFVDNGQIVLNVSISAVQGLVLGDKAIEFQARFGGKICKVYAPVGSILAIYAKENGRGMVFAEEEEMFEDETSAESLENSESSESSDKITSASTSNHSSHSGPKLIEKEKSEEGMAGTGGEGGGKGKGKGGRGHLTLVK